MGAFPLWNFKPATREKHQQYIYMTRLWIAYPLVYLSIYIYILKYKYIYTDLNLPHLKLFAAIYIYISIFIFKLTLCLSHAKDMPLMWKHANLESLERFLQEEQQRGNFTPQTGLPL